LLLLQVVFLFSDTQIKDESLVEDLSNLLNTYEVPNLIGSGDLAGIFENIRPRAKQAGMDGSRDQLYKFFVQEVSCSAHYFRVSNCPSATCSLRLQQLEFQPKTARPARSLISCLRHVVCCN
jgi:hypothetical protein